MPYIPQPLKHIKESIGEKMEKDADYAILLSDINDYTVSVFSNFQKQAVPVIQENYIQRNMIFQNCHDKLKRYKESYKDVEADLEDQFQIFKQQLLQHIEEICELRMTQQDEEIVVNRGQLGHVQSWVGDVNALLEEATSALQKYEKFYQNSMKNHTTGDDANLDINFFEENARNQEKLTALDNATSELERLVMEYKTRDDEIQNLVKQMQSQLP